jgi:YesN/AraC family two-component response regulator
VLTLVIIAFVVWRVETLQILLPEELEGTEETVETEETEESREVSLIGSLLVQHCEAPKLYLQYDLTLTQLALALGTNRTYLGAYFAARGETYNAYINRLRIDHFIGLYQEAAARGRNVTAQQLSAQSGYRNYTTFSNAFKQRTGQNVTQWIKTNT